MMMKFLAFFLLVAASVGIVTAQNDAAGAGVVCPAVCKSVACGPEGLLVEVCAAKVVNGKCTWPCPAPTTTGPDMCIQGGAPPAGCPGEGQHEWDNKACKWICKICTEKCTAKCLAGQSCVFDKTCTPTCKSSTANTCVLNDGISRIVSGGKYYHQCNQCTCGDNGQPGVCTRIGCPEGPFNNDGKPVPPVCTERCTAKCSEWQDCVFDETCKPTCKAKSCSVLFNQPCPESANCVDSCPADMMCIPGHSGTCQPKTCAQQGRGCATVKCATGPCIEDPVTCEATCPKPMCTEKCTAKCTSGQKCVFDKTCTPTCRSSTANTCLLNDGISRIVSGGKFFQQCNTCTCGGNGQSTVCTEIGCEDGKYNNDGTLVPPPVCTEKCTKDCPFGQSCVFDKTCTPTCRTSTADTCVLNDGFSRIVSGGRYYQQCNQCTCQRGCTKKGCENTSVWNNDGTVPDILPHACFVDCQINGGCRTICQYPISFKIRYTGTIKQLATQLRKVATDAGIDSSLVVIDNTQLVLISSNIYRCRIVIKGSRGDTSNRDKYMVQLEKSFTVSGVIIFENGDNNNNEVELDSEIEMEPLGDAQPFTTQTCADDTTIAASASCPAITEEGMIIPTATSSSSSSFPLAIVIGSVVGGVIALVLLTTAIIIIQRRRTANKVVARTSAEQEMTNTV